MAEVQDAIEYFLNEHETMNSKLAELEGSLQISCEKKDERNLLKALEGLLGMKQEFKRHSKEEEKALFPAFEFYIMKEGGAFMIMEHPNLMAAFNDLATMMVGGFSSEELYKGGLTLISMLRDHAERENTILNKLASFSAQANKDRVLKELEGLRASL